VKKNKGFWGNEKGGSWESKVQRRGRDSIHVFSSLWGPQKKRAKRNSSEGVCPNGEEKFRFLARQISPIVADLYKAHQAYPRKYRTRKKMHCKVVKAWERYEAIRINKGKPLKKTFGVGVRILNSKEGSRETEQGNETKG